MGWLEREDEWLGPRRMDAPPPLPPMVRASLERVVYWSPTAKCRRCGGKSPVTSKRGAYRYHKCQDCGFCFKSVEPK